MDIVSGLFAILTGGATGLIGTAISMVSNFLKAKQEIKRMEVEHRHEVKLHELNIEARGKEMEHETLIAESAERKAIRGASYRHDTGYGQGGPVLTFILRMVRPALTVILLALVAWFWLDLDADDELVDVHALKTKIVNTVVYLATAAVTWWFGSRDLQKRSAP